MKLQLRRQRLLAQATLNPASPNSVRKLRGVTRWPWGELDGHRVNRSRRPSAGAGRATRVPRHLAVDDAPSLKFILPSRRKTEQRGRRDSLCASLGITRPGHAQTRRFGCVRRAPTLPWVPLARCSCRRAGFQPLVALGRPTRTGACLKPIPSLLPNCGRGCARR